jgi:hypothetical protein
MRNLLISEVVELVVNKDVQLEVKLVVVGESDEVEE